MSDRDVDATPKIVRAAAAEFIGVFIFVFSGCAAAIGNTNIFAIACAVLAFPTRFAVTSYGKSSIPL